MYARICFANEVDYTTESRESLAYWIGDFKNSYL